MIWIKQMQTLEFHTKTGTGRYMHDGFFPENKDFSCLFSPFYPSIFALRLLQQRLEAGKRSIIYKHLQTYCTSGTHQTICDQEMISTNHTTMKCSFMGEIFKIYYFMMFYIPGILSIEFPVGCQCELYKILKT